MAKRGNDMKPSDVRIGERYAVYRAGKRTVEKVVGISDTSGYISTKKEKGAAHFAWPEQMRKLKKVRRRTFSGEWRELRAHSDGVSRVFVPDAPFYDLPTPGTRMCLKEKKNEP